jgi:DNA-binding response OmpR family regulator
MGVDRRRDQLASVWGPEYAEQLSYLWPVITSLRKKFGSGLINTEPGVGYRLRVANPQE